MVVLAEIEAGTHKREGVGVQQGSFLELVEVRVFQRARMEERWRRAPESRATYPWARAPENHTRGRVARTVFYCYRPGLDSSRSPDQPGPPRPRPTAPAPTRSHSPLPGHGLTSQPDPVPSRAGPLRTRAAKTETAPGSALYRFTQSEACLATAARGDQKGHAWDGMLTSKN